MAFNATELLHGLLGTVGRNIPGVMLRISAASVLGLIFGVLLFILWHRHVVRRGWLRIHLKVDRVLHYIIVPLWALAIPVLGLLSGFSMGVTLACTYVVHHEHLGEKAGKLAFSAIVAVVIATQKAPEEGKKGREEILARARRLIKGEEEVPISYLKTISPRNLAEISTLKLEDFFPVWENKVLHAISTSIMERSITWIVKAAASDRTELLYKISNDLERRDEATDGDGFVTVEEISATISRLYLEKQISGWIYLEGVSRTMVFLVPLVLVITVPPVISLAARYIIELVRRKAAAGNAPGAVTQGEDTPPAG